MRRKLAQGEQKAVRFVPPIDCVQLKRFDTDVPVGDSRVRAAETLVAHCGFGSRPATPDHWQPIRRLGVSVRARRDMGTRRGCSQQLAPK